MRRELGVDDNLSPARQMREHAAAADIARDRRWAALLALLVASGACHTEGKTLRSERRVPIPGGVDTSAVLRIDARGREWIVEPGRRIIVDTGKAAVPARIAGAAGALQPAPLFDAAGRVFGESAGTVFPEVSAATGARRPSIRADAPVAHDPANRWYYVGTGQGGVLGVGADSLRILWGWPELGGRVTAIAVSPLADRVYIALTAREPDHTEPWIATLDAQSGRLLGSAVLPRPASVLFASRDGWVRGLAVEDDRAEIIALAPTTAGLTLQWRVSLRKLGLHLPAQVRVSPTGGRVAVFNRDGGGVHMLDGATGEVIGRTKESPLDANFDAGGHLHLLYRDRTAMLP